MPGEKNARLDRFANNTRSLSSNSAFTSALGKLLSSKNGPLPGPAIQAVLLRFIELGSIFSERAQACHNRTPGMCIHSLQVGSFVVVSQTWMVAPLPLSGVITGGAFDALTTVSGLACVPSCSALAAYTLIMYGTSSLLNDLTMV